MKSLVKENGLSNKIHCDSAGTISYHVGETPDTRMIEHASKRGYNLDSIGRHIQRLDLEHFDYILTMDDENYENVLALDPEGNYKHKIFKMTKFCREYNAAEVPDPYYGGPQGFEHVLNLLEDASAGLLEYILKEHPELS